MTAPAPERLHTPGPWRVGEMHAGKIDILHAHGNVPGAITLILARVSARPGWIVESEANAKLIAAAPRLLRALNALADAVKGHSDNGLDISDPMLAAWREASEAIKEIA